MDNKELLETFKAKYVGRGVWFTVTEMITCVILKKFTLLFDKQFQIKTIHLFFMLYCQNIYCLICRYHAANFIKSNPKDLSSPLAYFWWICKFHRAANINAGKTSPDDKIINDIYLKGNGSSELNYHTCQIGIWHFFFIVATKCVNRGQIIAFYYLIIEFMANSFEEQKQLFIEFASEHKFSEALSTDDMTEIDLCISFFEWIYAMYAFINERSNEKVYSLELIKYTYYNLEYCTDKCDG